MNKVNKLLKTINQPVLTPIGSIGTEGLYLPNHSGQHVVLEVDNINVSGRVANWFGTQKIWNKSLINYNATNAADYAAGNHVYTSMSSAGWQFSNATDGITVDSWSLNYDGSAHLNLGYSGSGSFKIATPTVIGGTNNTTINEEAVTILSADTADPMITWQTTNHAHKMRTWIDESQAAGTNYYIVDTDSTSADCYFHVKSGITTSTECGISLYTQSNRRADFKIAGATGNVTINANTTNSDLIFMGTAGTVTWDTSADNWLKSTGIWKFDNDNIVTTGNVGIGFTTAPTVGLHVHKDKTYDADGSSGLSIFADSSAMAANKGGGISFWGNYQTGTSSQTTAGGIETLKVNGTSGDYGWHMRFLTRQNGGGAGTIEKMRILSTGEVGIGTTTPDTKLQVVGAIKAGDDNTNYTTIGTTGDVSFTGSAGFYPRRIRQDDPPAAGTGSTQIDTGELMMWCDSNDSDKVWLVYNDTTKGIVKIALEP